MTLADFMEAGGLGVPEAVRLAMKLAECLRKSHEEGRVHGALTPQSVSVTNGIMELLPAPEGPPVSTVYSAPEVVQGLDPDVRADIYSFGAIVLKLATGCPPAEGSGDQIESGDAGLDRILEGCLAKNPAARVPRIQNVNLELKLLTVATRRSEAAAVVRRERAEAATRSDMRDLEVRIEARFTAQADVYEKAFSNLERAANDTVEIFREQLAGLRTELAAAQDRVAALEGSVKTAGETAGGIRGELDDFAKRSQQVEQSVVTELRELARHMKAHAAAIEAARASTTHNEELLERVIGELASLQADVLEPEHPAAEEAVLA